MEEKINGNRGVSRLDFKEIITLNIRFLQAFGNFIPEFQTRIGRFFFLTYAVLFLGIIYAGMLISEVVNMIKVLGDMEKVTDASFLTLTHVVQLGKFYYLYKYHEQIKHLLQVINRAEFQPKTQDQYTTAINYIQFSKTITKIFLLACVVTCSFWGVYPFTVDGEIFLPLAGWYPFDTTWHPMFEIVYAYQVVGSTLNGLSNISLDTFMSGFFFLGMITSELINFILAIGDMEKMTEASFLTLTHVVALRKVYATFTYRAKLKILLNSFDRTEFQPKNSLQRTALNNYVEYSKLISKVFLSACVVTCTFWAVYPFIDDGDLHLPLAGWYPFDTSKYPWFQVAYVYQVIGSNINGITNVSMDTFMSGLIMFVCAQLNMLNDSLKNMRQHAEADLKKNEICVQDMTKELQDKMNEKFLECIIHHQYIIDFAKEVTFLFTTSILGQFIVSVVIICITLFQITLLPWMSIKFFSLILYQCCMLLEIFLLCYYGNEVIRESTELTKFAFCSDWMDCSTEFKRNLLFFMTRSQAALKLYAGGFFTLSLETFVKILKSSWSYFAVLNSVHSQPA